MAVPTDYIFTSGSCRKDAIFDLIVNTLKSAGWTDISSLASSDFIVLHSTGNTGDHNLILNLRETSSTAANSVKTTAYCAASYRLEDTYTSGDTGVAGTFGRPSLAWTNLFIAPVAAATTTLPVDTIVDYKVYADASKIILALEYPNATNLAPQLIYMGEPDSLYCNEDGSSGVLVACSSNAAASGSAQICNTPAQVGSVTAPYAETLSALLPTKSPNNSDKYIVSEIYYQTSSEGIRGKLDGIYCALNSNLLTGDTITIDSQTYYVLCCQSVSNNSFPSLALLVRTA